MAENTFDALLRQALAEANWREWQPLWETEAEPDFSSGYQRWRLRLLADPFGWMKKRLRPLWVKTLRTAACLVLASAVVLGSLMAVSPTVRAAVLNWLREISGNHVAYTSSDAPSPNEPLAWYPTFLPEGWSLEEAGGRSDWLKYCFAGSEGRVTFRCAYPNGGSIGFALEDETVQNKQQITIQGYPADLYIEDEQTYLVWQGQDGILFTFSGNGICAEDLVRIAESVEPVEGDLPEDQLLWTPDGYMQYERADLPAAVQETWMGPDTSLTLLYSAETLKVPEGPAKIVEVNGIEAQYWGAEESYEAGDSSMTVNGEEIEGSQTEIGGVTIFSGTIVGPDADGVNTLAWDDPDTGIHFRLHSTVNLDTLLRVAESIGTKETSAADAAVGEAAGD